MNSNHAPGNKSIIALIVAGAFVVIWAVTMYAHYRFAQVELYIDEYDIAKVSRTLYRGGQMYLDEFNEKSPGIYWLIVTVYKVFGERFIVLRYIAAASVSFSLLLLLAIGIRLKKPFAGLLAGAIFAFLHLFFHGYIYHGEALLTPLFLLAAFLVLGHETQAENKLRFLLLGLVLFLATIAKQTAWIMAGALLVAPLWRWRKSKSPMPIIFYALGLATPWLLLSAYFAWRGYLGAFIAGYTYPLHSFDTTFYTYLPFSHDYYMELPVWWLLLVSLLSPAFSSLRAADRCVLVALPTAAATIMAPAFFPYHFPPLLALSSLAFALTTFYLRPQFRAMKWIAGGGLIVLTAAAIALTGPAQIRNRLLHPEHPAVARIVREIERTTSPDDAIFAFPFDSVYNLKADRPAPGAYGWVSPWVLPPDKLKKFLAEFAQRPPALVLYVYFDKCTTNGARPKDYLEPLLARLLKDYRIREIYPNNVVMLERLAPGEETAPGERCLLEKLLYTDLDCRGVVPPLAQWRRECEL